MSLNHGSMASLSSSFNNYQGGHTISNTASNIKPTGGNNEDEYNWDKFKIEATSGTFIEELHNIIKDIDNK